MWCKGAYFKMSGIRWGDLLAQRPRLHDVPSWPGNVPGESFSSSCRERSSGLLKTRSNSQDRSLVSWFSHLCVEIVNPLSLHLVYILKILYTYLNSFFYSYLDVAVSIYSLTWEPCLCLFILYTCHYWNVIIWTTMSNIMRIFFERISSIIFTHLFILWNYFSLFFFQHFLFFRSLFDLLMYILNLCQCSLW